MEVKLHPADSQKVIMREDSGEKWTAVDNIDGEFDEYLTPDERAQREEFDGGGIPFDIETGKVRL
jgi:hypothetical protein